MPMGTLVRFKPTAKQKEQNRNIARIARKTIGAKMETKANRVQQLTPIDVKFHHETNVNFEELTEITQGDSDRQRIGNSISGKRIHVRLLLRNSDNATASDGLVRVLVVKSKAGPFAQTDFDILNPAGTDGYPVEIDLDSFVIKHDRTYQLGTSLADGQAQYPPFREVNLTFKGVGKVTYAENTDMFASVNPWYLLFYRVDNSGVNTAPMTYVLSSRLFYKDA